jgi:hypothetical protein
MSRKIGILIALLVLGLILIGGGAWLLHDSTTEDIPEESPITINLPEDEPVIYERVNYLMRGENYELYIYDNGGILYIQEKGLRFSSPEHPATRTWSTGNLTAEQVNNLLAYLENSGLDKLDEKYLFPGEPLANGGLRSSDVGFTIIVNSDNLSKKVTAFEYLSPDNGETYPGMPSPLNEIYGRLRTLAMTTQEVYRENISP